MDDYLYTLCGNCHHFVEEDDLGWIHLTEDEWPWLDHDAIPSRNSQTLSEWKKKRPDLFYEHDDGHIGPNSAHSHVDGYDWFTLWSDVYYGRGCGLCEV